MRAQDIYTLLVLAIDQACESEGFMEVCEVAGHHGMRGGRVTAFNALKYEYTYSDSDGHMVHLNIRSYDPSGPFQNIPDINRFTVKLVIGSQDIAIHDRQYSD